MKNIDMTEFRNILNADRPNDPLTEDEASAALRTIGELVWLLYKINEREKIVSVEELTGIKCAHDTHKD